MALDYTNYCGSGSGSKPGGTTVLGNERALPYRSPEWANLPVMNIVTVISNIMIIIYHGRQHHAIMYVEVSWNGLPPVIIHFISAWSMKLWPSSHWAPWRAGKPQIIISTVLTCCWSWLDSWPATYSIHWFISLDHHFPMNPSILGIWGVPELGVPPNGWFIMENLSVNGWFRGTTILGKLHLIVGSLGFV